MKRFLSLSILGLLLVFLFPNLALSANNLSFSAWVPYWKKTLAVPEAVAHLSQLKTISPFSYEVKADGALIDKMKITTEPWTGLLSAARKAKIKVIPSILWTDAKAINTNLYSVKRRQAHINNIAKIIKAGGYDGIDIDYETKMAETKTYFSKFIKELSVKLHSEKKILSCTIEPRTPDASRFNIIPENLAFANDYQILAKYCDEVRLMAYDQGTIDLRLNEVKGKNNYYVPVADADWVAKIITTAKKDIPANKLILGVANYGYEYEATSRGNYYNYKKLRALNYKTMMELASSVGVVPTRNQAGELGFSYNKNGPIRVISFSDSVAIAQKVAMAKKFNLKGVALFKVDGESDPNLWPVLK